MLWNIDGMVCVVQVSCVLQSASGRPSPAWGGGGGGGGEVKPILGTSGSPFLVRASFVPSTRGSPFLFRISFVAGTRGSPFLLRISFVAGTRGCPSSFLSALTVLNRYRSLFWALFFRKLLGIVHAKYLGIPGRSATHMSGWENLAFRHFYTSTREQKDRKIEGRL